MAGRRTMRGHSLYHLDCPTDAPCRIDRRALALWHGLNQRALVRCRHDPIRISSLAHAPGSAGGVSSAGGVIG